MNRWKKTCIFLLLALCAPPALDAARAPSWRHEDLWLKNELGQRITPTRNSADPYSPRRTCGTCHGYMTVTSGYHFQQGFDQMRTGFDPKRPWALSPGSFGRGGDPGTFTQHVAAKKNAGPRDMGLSTYDWIAGGNAHGDTVLRGMSGFTHPGGGPLEFGRTADGRRDLSKNLIRGEALNTAPLDGDYSSRFTPDGKSRFRESGVVEADCLMCHLNGYRLDRRNRQLSLRNYRWAATAGAGLGEVEGAVREEPSRWNLSTRPAVRYAWSNQALFTPDGRFRGSARIRKSVDTANCTQCHRSLDGQKSGTLYLPAGDVPHIPDPLQRVPLLRAQGPQRLSPRPQHGRTRLVRHRQGRPGRTPR